MFLPCVYIPEHQVYTYDDSESPRGQAAQRAPRAPDAVSVSNESSQRPNQKSTLRDKGRAEPREKAPDDQEDQDQLKLSRCFSDPGPSKEDDEDGAFLSWWSSHIQYLKAEDEFCSTLLICCIQ